MTEKLKYIKFTKFHQEALTLYKGLIEQQTVKAAQEPPSAN